MIKGAKDNNKQDFRFVAHYYTTLLNFSILPYTSTTKITITNKKIIQQ